MNKKFDKKLARENVSRARYTCPEELNEMIEISRLVPYDLSLPPIVEFFRSEIIEEKEQNLGGIFHFIFHGRDEVYLERILRRMYPESSPLLFLEEYVKRASREFRDYIMQIDAIEFKDPFFDQPLELFGESRDTFKETYIFIGAMCRYTDFYRTRLSLQLFANSTEAERRRPRTPPNAPPKDYPFELPINISIKREADGKLHLTGLAKAIEEGFDDSRLRKCKKCNSIFWAKREDSKTCSKKCLNAYNVQEYRKLSDEDKMKKKLQREANKIYKKGRKSATS